MRLAGPRPESCNHGYMKTLKAGSYWNAFGSSCLVVGVILLVSVLDFFIPLKAFGILPRTVPGLIGIIFSPLLHLNAAHLFANSLPLFVLLMLLFWDRRYHPALTLAAIWVASGFGTWLIGRGNAIHIGASSLVYGLVVYLIAAAFWMKRWRSAAVAVFVFVIYGGIFFGLLPQLGQVSWEGHLAGAIAGLWTARKNHT